VRDQGFVSFMSVVGAWVIVCGRAGPPGFAQVAANATTRRLLSARVND
jgi:hypothetical protein